MDSTRKSSERQWRQARLSAALRENLRRRKAQARGRQSDPDPADAAGPAGDADIHRQADSRLSPQSQTD